MKFKSLSVISLIVLMVLPKVSVAQPDTLWTRTFGGNGDESGASVKQTSDGGFIITGFTTSIGNGSRDVWLIKINSNGTEEWNQTFGGSDFDWGYEVQQTYDGGFIIVGSTKSFGSGDYDIWLIKTDITGNEEWNQTFGGSESGMGYSVQQTSDGGYIVVGSGSKTIIKTDENGNELWSQSYNAAGFSIKQTLDSGYIITGQISSAFGPGLWLIKTDTNGNEEWSDTYSVSGGYKTGWSVHQTSDGGYIITGETDEGADHNVWLIKTDGEGVIEWDKTFGDNHYQDGREVQQTIDGGYIIIGNTDTGADMGNFWLIKTDTDGNEEWSQTFGGSDYEFAAAVQQISDGGYIIAGYTRSFGNGGSDMWLIRLASETPPYSGPTGLTATPWQPANYPPLGCKYGS